MECLAIEKSEKKDRRKTEEKLEVKRLYLKVIPKL